PVARGWPEREEPTMATATLRTDSSPLAPALKRLRELRSSGDLHSTSDDLSRGVDELTERVREASEHVLETLPGRVDAVMADAGETLRIAGDSLREAGDSLRATVHDLSAPPKRRGPSTTRILASIAIASAAIGIGAWLARRRADAWQLTPVGPGRLDRATSTSPVADPLTSARLDREAVERAADEGMATSQTLTDLERRDVLSPDPLTADAASGESTDVRSGAGAWTDR